jgi:hypothetical protein
MAAGWLGETGGWDDGTGLEGCGLADGDGPEVLLEPFPAASAPDGSAE